MTETRMFFTYKSNTSFYKLLDPAVYKRLADSVFKQLRPSTEEEQVSFAKRILRATGVFEEETENKAIAVIQKNTTKAKEAKS